MPSLFIGGALDPVLLMSPPGVGEPCLDDHRGTVLVDGAGHWVQQQSPDEVNAALLDFLAGLGLEDLMRAAALHDGRIVVRDDVPEPVPGFGQVLVAVKACGICGSDLHFATHGDEMLALGEEMEGVPDLGAPPVDLDRRRVHGPRVRGRGPRASGPTPSAPPRARS